MGEAGASEVIHLGSYRVGLEEALFPCSRLKRHCSALLQGLDWRVDPCRSRLPVLSLWRHLSLFIVPAVGLQVCGLLVWPVVGMQDLLHRDLAAHVCLSSLSLALSVEENPFRAYLLVATGTAKTLCQAGTKEGSRTP